MRGWCFRRLGRVGDFTFYGILPAIFYFRNNIVKVITRRVVVVEWIFQAQGLFTLLCANVPLFP